MALSDMQVFQDFAYSAATETLRQKIELFNAASGGTLILSQKGNIGDYSQEASYKAIANLMRRRDAYGSGSLTATTLEQLNHVAVKVAGGTAPVLFEPQQMTYIQRNPEEAGVVIGEQLAKGMMADHLNTTILGLRAAMSGVAAVNYDGTAATLSLGGLVTGASKFGDRATDLGAWIMHSKSMHDLYASNVANGNDLFEFGTVRISQDGFGRRLIMTDSPSLVEVDGGGAGVNHYYTIGLASAGARVEDNGDLFANVETTNGSENIQRTFQAEYTYNLGLKGYSWNTAVVSPSDAAIGTPANWTQIATDVKDTAGVLITSL